VDVDDVGREVLERVANDAGRRGVDAQWDDRSVEAHAKGPADDAHVGF
jgi:hypothetical protein